MPSERMNYCRALGLNPFKETEYDDEAISEAVKAASKSWTESMQKRASARMRHQNWELLKHTSDIKAVMGNEVLRKAEFERARRIITLKASHLKRCTVTSRNGTVAVIPSLASKAAANLMWNGVTARDMINASGLGSGEIPSLMPDTITRTSDTLREIGFYTPYEFVNSILAIHGLNFECQPMTEDDGPNAFFTALDTIYAKRDRFATNNVPDWEAYNNAIIRLHDVRTAKEISELTIYGDTYRAVEPVLEVLDVDAGVGFTSDFLDDLVKNNLTGRVRDMDLAVNILERYCFSHAYPANFSSEDSRLTICPSCGALTETGDDACVCAYCSAPVKVRCPRCGEIQSAVNESCVGCGLKLADSLGSIRQDIGRIQTFLDSGSLEEADATARRIATDYPHAEGIDDLVSRIGERMRAYREIVDDVTELFRVRRFHTLKSRVDAALREFPTITADEEVGSRYREAVDAVDRADALCLGASSDEDFISAAEICPDHPDALAVLSTRPPEGPADGSVSSHADGIVITYAVPADRRSMEFCIYRGVDAFPEVNSETVPTYVTPYGTHLDTEAEPGAKCYYRVYSRRWGVLSKDYAEAGPGVLIREVTNVSITPLEDGLRAEYSAPAGCRRVRVWRKVSGTAAGIGEEIEIDAGDGVFEDRGLTGGQVYAYLFVAEYADGLRSSGTVFRGETPVYPDPVTDMSVEWDRDTGRYTARWSSDREVTLYTSATLHEFPGRATPMSDVESWLKKIDPVETFPGGAVFDADRGYASFVTPVIRVGTTGVIGNSALIANLRPLCHVTKSVEEGMITLRFPWPEGSVGVMAECDGDRIVIGRGSDESEGEVKVPLGTSTHRTVSLCAVYDVAGANMMSSVVTTDVWGTSFAKIRYTVREERAVNDREMSEVTVRISCPGVTAVPRMVIIQSSEGIPLRITDGRVLWTSDDPVVLTDGTADCVFYIRRDEVDVSRMRMFLYDRVEYGRFRIIHPLYRRD